MSSVPSRSPHSLLHFFPHFLQRRRRGFGGLAEILAETGLSRPALFQLVRLAEEPAMRGTVEALRPGYPYTTQDMHLPWLAEAQTADYIAQDGAVYALTARGLDVVTRLEAAAAAHLASLTPLPAEELRELAAALGDIAAGLDRQALDPGGHLHRADRLAALVAAPADAPLVAIERAIYALWMARDDAHIDAWMGARFPPQPLAILTTLWHGEIDSLDGLTAALAPGQSAEDVAGFVEELIEQGYVEWRLGVLQPTRAGYNVRETIEGDTDELYYRQWPDLDSAAVNRLHDLLTRLLAALPDAPGPARARWYTWSLLGRGATIPAGAGWRLWEGS